jgi:hypothetical protein
MQLAPLPQLFNSLNNCSVCGRPPHRSTIKSGSVPFHDRYCPGCKRGTSGIAISDADRRWNEMNPKNRKPQTEEETKPCYLD